jgi:hypothetical protein
MKTRRTLVLASKLALLVAIGATADAVLRTAQASDAAAEAYLQAVRYDARDVTGTINTRTVPASLYLPPAARQALTAWSHFKDARAAMERGLLLGEGAPKMTVAALEAAMAGLQQEMKLLAGTNQAALAAAVKNAAGLTQDWYEAGLKYIKPPAEGLIELPTQVVVAAKADAAAAALDRLLQVASAPAPARIAGSPRKRTRAARPVPVATASDPFAEFMKHSLQ